MPNLTMITIVQRNWDGKGNSRTHTRWVKPHEVDRKLARIAQAYNMDNTTVTVG